MKTMLKKMTALALVLLLSVSICPAWATEAEPFEEAPAAVEDVPEVSPEPEPEASPLPEPEATPEPMAEPAVVASGTCGGEGDGSNLTWVLTEDGVLTISGEGNIANYNLKTNLAPWYDYRNDITSVVIEDGVTFIGGYAYYDYAHLTGVIIGDAVTSIGKYAFTYCDSLASVNIPDSVTFIERSAFFCCTSLTEIHFEGATPEFGEELFYDVTATAYYPAGNDTWTEEVMQDYGGDITWEPYGSSIACESCTDSETTVTVFYSPDEVDLVTAVIALYDRNGKLMRTEWHTATANEDGQLTASISYSHEEFLQIGRIAAFAYDSDTMLPLCGSWSKTRREAEFDADSIDSYAEAVTVLTEMGVFDPYIDDSFQPDVAITRADLAQIVYRIVHADLEDKYAGIYVDYGKFSDVKKTDWFAGYVNYCFNGGYMAGTGDGKFVPDGTVTGYQVLLILLRALGYDREGELRGAGWEVRTARKAKELGLTRNVIEGTLGAPATREMAAELVFRAISEVSTVDWTQLEGYTERNVTLGYEMFGLRGTVEEIEPGSDGYTADDFAAMTTPETVFAEDLGVNVTYWYLNDFDSGASDGSADYDRVAVHTPVFRIAEVTSAYSNGTVGLNGSSVSDTLGLTAGLKVGDKVLYSTLGETVIAASFRKLNSKAVTVTTTYDSGMFDTSYFKAGSDKYWYSENFHTIVDGYSVPADSDAILDESDLGKEVTIYFDDFGKVILIEPA